MLIQKSQKKSDLKCSSINDQYEVICKDKIGFIEGTLFYLFNFIS